MEDESDFLMSLNDILTCGFGASVLLFIVFAVLVVLEEGDANRVAPNISSHTRVGPAIDQVQLSAKSQLYVRLASEDCELIKNIGIGNSNSQSHIWSRLSQNNICVATLRIEEQALRLFTFYVDPINLNKTGRFTYTLRAMLGSTSLINGDVSYIDMKNDSHWLFSLEPGKKKPIAFPAGTISREAFLP